MKNQAIHNSIRYGFVFLAAIGLIFPFAASVFAQANDGERKLLDSQRTVLAQDAAWSSITSLADGSLAVIYEKARSVLQVNSAPNVSMEWIRSTDGGVSWSAPITVAERLGDGGQLYDNQAGGGYVVYEQRNQSFGQMSNGRIVCAMDNLDYYYNSQGQAVVQNHLGSTFRYTGMSYTYSDDLGQTWHPLQTMQAGPFGGEHQYEPYIAAGTNGRIIALDDGTALMSIYGSLDTAYTGPLDIPAGTTYMAGIMRSTDNGLTWGDPSLIMTKSTGLPYEETNLCRVSDDRLLAEVRTQADTLVQYVSNDEGKTWGTPTDVTEAGQIPGSAFQLADGTLMLTWGNRREPYGAMAMLSYDDGQTWDYEHRVSLAWDVSNAGGGYAYGAQAGDGSIVVTYYDMISGWSNSSVYTIRFTEDQFLRAAGLHAPEPSMLAMLAVAMGCLLCYANRRRRKGGM